MSRAARNGWIVATSIGAVEALKDQLGVCRWNYGLRLIQQNAKKSVQSYYSALLVSSKSHSASPCDGSNIVTSIGKKIEKKEKGMKKMMDLSCLGPTTVRF
ncbi:Wound-responsive family protein [Striga hermonthica]|uniref:Wound-responsive family protein n=1 Tax=Striga hermonthica TaxID=68872 RepID=A0A9N7MM38_STRHE|nr:Wound-responsive family protein [Striga hermonthica]